MVDNVKEDRTPEDLLFQVMLDLGVLLSSSIEVKRDRRQKRCSMWQMGSCWPASTMM